MIVQIDKVSKSFGKQQILKDVSVDVFEADNLVVFGQSGSGKSVLLKCIIGLLTPDSGTVHVFNKNIQKLKAKELSEVRKQIGFLFQGAALYDSMSVRENLEFPLTKNFEFSKGELDDKVENTLELVNLGDAIDKMPSELSGGMRKRIGLARSIITDPRLMLYDEPTTGLDPISSKDISELIRNLQHELKMTSIVVTHDLICAEIIADKAIFLRDSMVAFEGKIPELTKSDDPFLKNFFSNEIIKE